MRTQKLTALIATIVLLTAATAQEAEKPPKEKLSDTHTATCLVKVTADPAILPLNFETIEHLLHSSGVAGKAAREVLNLSLDKSHELFSITPLPIDPWVHNTQPRVQDSEDWEQEAFERYSGSATAKPSPAPSRSEKTAEPPATEDYGPYVRRYEGYGGYGGGYGPYGRSYGGYGGYSRYGPYGGYGKYYGGYGPYQRYGIAPAVPEVQPKTPMTPPTLAGEQTLLFRMQVELPGNVKHAAQEFMNATVENLRQSLIAAFDAHLGGLKAQLDVTRQHHEARVSELSNRMGIIRTPADLAAIRQLNHVVDLSQLNPEMSFSHAIEELKRSVDPPLNIIVLWRDLIENADIDQTTPINMDPIAAAPLRKALELLLKSVSAGIADLAYAVEDGIIIIATSDSLPTPQQKFALITQTDTSPAILQQRKHDLLRQKQSIEMHLARLQARRSAVEEQIAKINYQVTHKVKNDPVAVELQALADRHAKLAKQAGDAIEQVLEKLARTRIELARRREELTKSAGGDRLPELTSQLTDLMIDLAERKAEFDVVGRQLEETDQQLKAAATFDPQISQIRVAKQALEVAEHHLNQLKARLANLRRPTVTILGAD